MRLKKLIKKTFLQGNTCVCGLRGTGKDLLFGNVIARRKKPYISNLDYTKGKGYQRLKVEDLDILNNYVNFNSDNIIPYNYPYLKESDIYLSDANVYFPSQYCSELNRKYPNICNYQALSRQISQNNFHFNTQNLNRVWDKIREQSDIYIRCRKSIVLFNKFVVQFITLYDKYESCVNRVKPFSIRLPLFNRDRKLQVKLMKEKFIQEHGSVKNRVLFYVNKSKHDTFYFGNLLSVNGEKIKKGVK